jgi:carboxypeptidase C (cathepsin A)
VSVSPHIAPGRARLAFAGVALLIAWLCLIVVPAGWADEAAGGARIRIPLDDLHVGAEGREGAHGRGARAELHPEPPLPPEAVSHHSLDIAGRRLTFTAKAGAAAFEDPPGTTVGEIGYFAYLLDGGEPRTRPVTFVINGGPGAGSAWLQLGAIGPWRLPLTQAAAYPSAPADLMPNAETWLDFTDLVFIDPVGTGYTRLQRTPGDAAKKASPPEGKADTRKGEARREADRLRGKFWSVEGDIGSVVLFISRWLAAEGRKDSPKMLVGESYGGFRAPRLAQALQAVPGAALGGIVMISPVLADRGLEFPGLGDVLRNVAQLPSLGAAIADAKGPVSAERLADLQREATGPYLADLLAGPRDKAAVERLAGRIAGLTGLDMDAVRDIGPRSAPRRFIDALDRKSGRTHSTYDATEKRDAAFDGARLIDGGDDLAGLSVRLARGMAHLSTELLGWKPGREYRALSRDVRWDWSGEESISALRSTLVRDPRFRALIAHGYADFVTPYFRTRLTLDQMPVIGAGPSRVRLEVYGGGHMFYTRDASRAQLRKDALRMYGEIAAP